MRQVQTWTIDDALENAIAAHNAGDYVSAEQWCRGILKHVPDHFPAHVAIAMALFEQRRLHEALYHINKADRLKPNHGMVLTNRGCVLAEIGDLEEAKDDCRRSIHFLKKNAIVWNNLGNVLEKMGEHTEALAAFDRALAIDPSQDISHYNRGLSLRRLGRLQEALAVFDRAATLNPENAEAVYNRATIRLTLGDLGGFEDYEARFRTREHRKPLYGPFPQPRWKGEDLTGKTLLVCAEQGMGDAIQFLRFLPAAALRAASMLLAVHEPLRKLCTLANPALPVHLLTPGTEWPPFDAHVNLMSLPWVLGCAREDLIPPPWNPFPGRRKGVGRQVGLCWSGNWLHQNDAHRSIPLEMFKYVVAPGCRYVNLQNDVRMEDRHVFSTLGMQDLGIVDFFHLANIIGELDLVVTVDTAVAHLAGSMGIPTWVLLPKYCTDWRWMLERETSPWYPSVRLFRQEKIGDWGSVIARVRSELELTTSKAA